MKKIQLTQLINIITATIKCKNKTKNYEKDQNIRKKLTFPFINKC